MFIIAENWKEMYPGASIGVLAMGGVSNPRHHSELDARKGELERDLRSRFSDSDRQALNELPAMAAYRAYYKRFKKTYHVLHQLESVVFKDKPIPSVGALVEAMFMAELKNLLLTAGHDLDVVQPPVRIDVAKGNERYRRLNGTEQALKAGDMIISDAEGILSSIIYGPDERSQIRPQTQRVLFTVYAPSGIEGQAVRAHLVDMRDNVKHIAPDAAVELMEVFAAT